MRNPTLSLTHPEVTQQGILAFAGKTPGAATGIKVTTLLPVLEGQRPKWINDILGLTLQNIFGWVAPLLGKRGLIRHPKGIEKSFFCI